jgi:4-phospho-D-threonate 3-dehydrogenase / 4-phospho-D-erythronate 3-dehydrogenase
MTQPVARRPAIALTMGDPAGVGPELILRAIASRQFESLCQLVVFGDWSLLRRCSQALGWPEVACRVVPVARLEEWIDSHGTGLGNTGLGNTGLGNASLGDSGAADSPADAVGVFGQDPVVVVDDRKVDWSDFRVGQVSEKCGAAAYRYIDAAINAASSGLVQAVTTAPINKEALQAAGHHYPGHTEIFAERTAGTSPWCMMQYSEKITCTFVTVHCGYSEVPALLTEQRILDTIRLTDQAMLRIRGIKPHLLVCGLNPHAGEHGLFGQREEELVIQPAIDRARQEGISVEGPIPADTAFLPKRLQTCDAIVCMYHDQGHIPVKALAFDSAVNTTLGLSIVRTSVDHGTAFDIAWTGQADPSSLFSAVRLAVRLADQPESAGALLYSRF